jgi:hypothetical protein
MKKQTKKLVLSKETVRDLATQDLRGVAGGTDFSEGGTCTCRSWDWIRQSTSYACPR